MVPCTWHTLLTCSYERPNLGGQISSWTDKPFRQQSGFQIPLILSQWDSVIIIMESQNNSANNSEGKNKMEWQLENNLRILKIYSQFRYVGSAVGLKCKYALQMLPWLLYGSKNKLKNWRYNSHFVRFWCTIEDRHVSWTAVQRVASPLCRWLIPISWERGCGWSLASSTPLPRIFSILLC